MRKQLLAFLIPATLAVTAAKAQTSQARPERWLVRITAGSALPVGKFASKNPFSNESGHAHPGPGAELAVTRWLTRTIGVALTAAVEKSPIGTFATLINPFTGGLTINNDPWKIARFGLGLDYTHPLSSRLSFDIRATAGLLKTRIPGYSYRIQNSMLYTLVANPPLQIVYTSKPLPWVFAYEAAADLKWHLKGKLFLFANASYAASNCNLHYSFVAWFTGSGYETDMIQHHQPIAIVQLGVGAGLAL